MDLHTVITTKKKVIQQYGSLHTEFGATNKVYFTASFKIQ